MPKLSNEWAKLKLNRLIKYLGVILQNDLHRNSHLSNLKKKTEPCHRTIIKSKTLGWT